MSNHRGQRERSPHHCIFYLCLAMRGSGKDNLSCSPGEKHEYSVWCTVRKVMFCQPIILIVKGCLATEPAKVKNNIITDY